MRLYLSYRLDGLWNCHLTSIRNNPERICAKNSAIFVNNSFKNWSTHTNWNAKFYSPSKKNKFSHMNTYVCANQLLHVSVYPFFFSFIYLFYALDPNFKTQIATYGCWRMVNFTRTPHFADWMNYLKDNFA